LPSQSRRLGIIREPGGGGGPRLSAARSPHSMTPRHRTPRPPRRPWPTGLLTAVLVGAGLTVALAQPPVPIAVAKGHPEGASRRTQSGVASIAITGLGYGHGRGMGQWGAFGYASEYGWSYQQVLAHYYGGTTLGVLSLPEPDITVHLTELDGHNTISVAPAGGALVASWGGGDTWTAPAFEVTRAGGVEVVYESQGCAGPWRQVGASTGAVTIASGAPGPDGEVPTAVGSSQLAACIPGVGERAYQGYLVAQPDGETQNLVGLEDYVDGVVPAESPASWAGEGGEAALEAQAVAARSYAVAYVATSGQICDTTACQVYLGVPDQYGPTADSAVSATQAEVLYCDAASSCGPAGSVALTEYSASTGGYSAGGAFPPVPDLGDSVPANPVHGWTALVPVSQVEAAFPGIGALLSVQVLQRNGLGPMGGRAELVAVNGSEGSETVPGTQFAAAIGLRSNWFAVGAVPGGTTLPGNTTTTTAPPGPTTSTSTVTSTSLPSGASGSELRGVGAAGGPGRAGGEPDEGYWVVDKQGVVSTFGDAGFFGTAAGTKLQGRVVAMAATPDGGGYWLAGSNGGVLAFGDARWYGSASDLRLRAPLVAMAATRDGRGYWLVTSDGGVFAYGDAGYYGSLASFHIGASVSGFAPAPGDNGYWLVTRDGGVFAFGDTGFYGSAAPSQLSQPISGILPSNDGRGYFLVARDGGVFAYGDAIFKGSLPEIRVRAHVVGAATTSNGSGYYVLSRAGDVYGFGDAVLPGVTDPDLSSVAVAIVCYRSQI